MHTDAQSLKKQGDRLFSQKGTLDSRNQELAMHFYPERSEFVSKVDIGDEWADHLMTGYPSMVRRDLGNAIGSMLRPRGQQWFHMATPDNINPDHAGLEWMEYSTGVQYRAMYDRVSQFTRAVKEGDHDFATFGSCVISTEVNRRDTALIFRNWHLRDVAWADDGYGAVGTRHRNWRVTARELVHVFGPEKCHRNVVRAASENPEQEFLVRHCVIRADEYDAEKRMKTPWVSVYMDCDHTHIIEEVGSWTPIYTIPRWATISQSQYAYSPAALIALPDARLIQAMTLTLLQAGEKAVDPPMVGVSEAINGEIAMYPGGFTAVDKEYDERLGDVLRPLTTDKNGLPFGLEISDRTSHMLREAFYLNTINMPPHEGPEMTAYEVGQRVQEYIRNAMPLFEPMEHSYNGELCETAFTTLLHEGAFGPWEDIPESIGEEIRWKFESPLAEMIEREKGSKFMESQAMIASAAEVDPDALAVVDFPTALRDVLTGIGTPMKWLRSEEEVDAVVAANREAEENAQQMAQMEAGADVASKLGITADRFASQAAI